MSNRSAFSSVWRWKVLSTRKPRRARSAAGCRASPSGTVPQRSSARSQVARVPGTPTETPLVTSSGVKLYGLPVAGSMNASCCIRAGAVSRPSMVRTFLLVAS